MQRKYCRTANWIWFHTRLNVHWVPNTVAFIQLRTEMLGGERKRQEMSDAFPFQHWGTGDGCHLFGAGQQKGALWHSKLHKSFTAHRGAAAWKIRGLLSSACPAADALISLRCTLSASPTTAACVHMLHLPCLFFSPFFKTNHKN